MSNNPGTSKATIKRKKARMREMRVEYVPSSSSESESSDSVSHSTAQKRLCVEEVPEMSSSSSQSPQPYTPPSPPNRDVGVSEEYVSSESGNNHDDIQDNLSSEHDRASPEVLVPDHLSTESPSSDFQHGLSASEISGEEEEDSIFDDVESANTNGENSDGDNSDSDNSDSDNSDSDNGDRDIEVETDGGSGEDSDPSDGGGEPGDVPLYQGAPLTVAESLIAVMTLALTHHLTAQCIADVLTLISLHCVTKDNCLVSLYKFKNFFLNIGQKILIFHYYCVSCMVNLEDKYAVCTSCNDPGAAKNYFIELPLLEQLQTMFRPGFYEKLQHRFHRPFSNGNLVHDIYDGRIYRELFNNGGFLSEKNNLSFMWYSDGMAVFKSSKFRVWPLYLVINELPYKERIKRENVILAGLWFGASKPDANVFLKPFESCFNRFREEGYEINVNGYHEPILVKGCVLCGTCDMPAKSLFLILKQFNAYFGCPRCKSRGERYPVGNSTVHVHRYEPNFNLRTNDEIHEFARAAVQTQRPVFGVMGPSRLYNMMPNMICGMGIDVMHMAFQGCSKLLLKLWFDSQYHDQPFSMCRLINVIDDRLEKIKPPSFIQRTPRSLAKHSAYWKAQEYKLWLMYYSIPVLYGIMNEEYLDHHIKLVSAIYLLSQESIAQEQIHAASNLLHAYVADFARLYSLRFMGINIHQLLHLPEVVVDLGPLWVYSCFFLEDLNGKLGKLIHGTRHAGLQVCSGASVFMNLSILIGNLPQNSDIRLFCEKLTTHNMQFKVAEEISPKMTVLGSYHDVPDHVKHAIQAHLDIVGGNYQQFHRLRKRGVVFVSDAYARANLKVSSYVSCVINQQSVLCKLDYFVRWSNCNCVGRCQCNEERKFLCVATQYNREIWHAHEVPNVRLSYLSAVRKTNNTIVFSVDDLRYLCFYMSVDEIDYIAEPVNTLEVE